MESHQRVVWRGGGWAGWELGRERHVRGFWDKSWLWGGESLQSFWISEGGREAWILIPDPTVHF